MIDPSGNAMIECTYRHARGGGFTTVLTDCQGLASDCCSDATPDDDGRFGGWVHTGVWKLKDAGPDVPAAPLCERVPYSALSGLDCFACCIEQKQNHLSDEVIGLLGGIGGYRRPKGQTYGKGAKTTNIWVRQCTKYSTSSKLTATVRIGGRISIVTVIVEGGLDCCLIALCGTECS